jgi:hypothetical protein
MAKPDTVLTLAIGRNYSKQNVPLSSGRWRNFRKKSKKLIENHAKIVAVSNGRGIGSDSTRKGKPENTFLIVAINPKNVRQLRAGAKKLLFKYNQTSAALAIAKKHAPVFSGI